MSMKNISIRKKSKFEAKSEFKILDFFIAKNKIQLEEEIFSSSFSDWARLSANEHTLLYGGIIYRAVNQ